VALEIAMPQHTPFSGLGDWQESAECHPCTATYGGAFDDKQLQQADASPVAIQFQLQSLLFFFKSSFETEAFLWLSFFREVKRPHARARKKTDALKGSKDRIECVLAAGMMLAPELLKSACCRAFSLMSRGP